MIFAYGFSLPGKNHLKAGTVCQDAHKILEMDNGCYIAAIADGLGSAKNSQKGAKIAVDTVIDFCNESLPLYRNDDDSIQHVIYGAYNLALNNINRVSKETGEAVESYDTTLSIVIYNGVSLCYGHSGDGAIIGLTTFGDFVDITKQQKGEDHSSVYPLRRYKHWKFGAYSDADLVSVLLMTDGIFDALHPQLIKPDIYVPLATYFADPNGIPNTQDAQEKCKLLIKDFLTADDDYQSEDFYYRLSSIYKRHIPNDTDRIIGNMKKYGDSKKLSSIGFMRNIKDDKTIVALINTDMQLDHKQAAFYDEPVDWLARCEELSKELYPGLYKDKVVNKPDESESPTEKGPSCDDEGKALTATISQKDSKEQVTNVSDDSKQVYNTKDTNLEVNLTKSAFDRLKNIKFDGRDKMLALLVVIIVVLLVIIFKQTSTIPKEVMKYDEAVNNENHVSHTSLEQQDVEKSVSNEKNGENTELQWSSPKTDPKSTWEEAKKYCEDLDEDGRSDWRLPDIDELKTLIQNCDKLVSCGMESCTKPTCPECLCKRVEGKYSKLNDKGYFWSSLKYEKDNKRVWGVNFNVGAPQAYDKNDKQYGQVRCVRKVSENQ